MNRRDEQGRAQGPWEAFHPDGGLLFKGAYLDGKQHGPWEFFHPNGALYTKGSYENGKKKGLWKEHPRE